MFYFKLFVAAAAIIGALDYLFGNKIGLGKEFSLGFELWGKMALSMIGLIVLSPWLAKLMEPFFDIVANHTPFDPSIIPASLLANDMGGSVLCTESARDELIGNFNGYVVSAMMGSTISYTLPVSLNMVDKSQIRELCLGMLCGIVTIPFGCFVAGLMMQISVADILIDLLPLVIIAAVIAFGLIKAPDLCVKIFKIVGFIVKALIVFGLCIGLLEFIPGIRLLPDTADYAEGAMVCVNAATVLAGMLVAFRILSKALEKPLKVAEKKLGINESSILGLLGSLLSNLTAFGIMHKMDRKGTILNSAFSVSAAFALGSHLAYTMSYCEAMVPYVTVGKLISGVCSLVLAWFIAKKYVQPEAK